jgi:6-phosphogluconolactonase (cycloisomerase 2 family)
MAVVLTAALAPLACGSSALEPRDGGGDQVSTIKPDDGGRDTGRGDRDGGESDVELAPGDAPSADGSFRDATENGRDGNVGDTSDGAADGNEGDTSDGGADGNVGDGGDGGRPAERLFVATYLGGLSSFTVDDSTGRPDPTAGSPVDVGAQLYALTIHPSGRFVYATDLRGRLIAYAISPATGTPAHLPGSPVTIGSAAIAAAIDPSGRFLYIGDQQSLHVFAVDQVTGAVTAIPDSPFDLGGQPCTIAFHPSGRFLFASFGAIGPEAHGGIRTFALDATSGAPTEVSGSPFLTDNVRGGGVVLHPNGQFLYVGSFNKLSGFLVDQDAGSLTPLPGFPTGGGNSDATAVDVALDPRGRYLYATDILGSVYGYAIDAGTGMLSALPGSPFDGGPLPYSVAVDPAGRFVYVGNDDANLLSVFSLDPVTGALAPIADSPFTVNGLQPEIAATGGHP